MPTFVVFLVIVALYVIFLLWCFAPLIRRARRRWLGWLRVAFGAILLAGNLFLPLLWPVAVPLYKIGYPLAEYFVAVALFPRTVPRYIANVMQWSNGRAILVEILYPIEIGGIRYAPTVQIGCTTRRMIAIDKGVKIVPFMEYPTASGGELTARAAGDIIAFDASSQICSMLKHGRLKLGAYPDRQTRFGIGASVYVIRGEADKTQLIKPRHDDSTWTVDDIVFQTPQIVRIEDRPAPEVVTTADLWPMARRGEMSTKTPALIRAYNSLDARVNPCVELVGSGQSRIFRYIPQYQRAEFCRRELERRIPQVPMAVLTPKQ